MRLKTAKETAPSKFVQVYQLRIFVAKNHLFDKLCNCSTEYNEITTQFLVVAMRFCKMESILISSERNVFDLSKINFSNLFSLRDQIFVLFKFLKELYIHIEY